MHWLTHLILSIVSIHIVDIRVCFALLAYIIIKINQKNRFFENKFLLTQIFVLVDFFEYCWVSNIILSSKRFALHYLYTLSLRLIQNAKYLFY